MKWNLVSIFFLFVSVSCFAQSMSCNVSISTDAPTTISKKLDLMAEKNKNVIKQTVEIENVMIKFTLTKVNLTIVAVNTDPKIDFHKKTLLTTILPFGFSSVNLPISSGKSLSLDCDELSASESVSTSDPSISDIDRATVKESSLNDGKPSSNKASKQ